MRDGIICHFNLFDFHQTVRKIEDDKITDIGLVETNKVGEMIGKYCLSNDVNYIHFYGDNLYIKRVIEDIDKTTNNLYSKKKIEIEVN